MKPGLTSVYIQVGNVRYRIGYGTVEDIRTGTFTVDKQERAQLDAALKAPEPEAEAAPEAEHAEPAKEVPEVTKPKRAAKKGEAAVVAKAVAEQEAARG